MSRVQLPRFSALIAFEAAARLSSFTRSAGELNVTQAAVSRQIRSLEQTLGLKLFKRKHRAVELTPEGVALAKTMSQSLSAISETISELTRGEEDDLSISALVAFSNLWLTPRLSDFSRKHPRLKVRVVTRDEDISLAKSEVDVALRFGEGAWTDGNVVRLFHEEVFPVCSPDYLARSPAIGGIGDLVHHDLIAYEQRHRDWQNWDEWLRHFGYRGPPISPHTHYSYYTDAVWGALDGQGILLGWRALIARHLANGSLVRVTSQSYRTKSAHYAVVSKASSSKPHVIAFVEWLKSVV